MSDFNFITVRLGKDSIPDIERICLSGIGVLEESIIINVKCTQIPENYNSGDYAFIWLGSDNNKGMPTKWKQGFKAIGRVKAIMRSASYNETSETNIEIVYIFKDAINRLDFLRSAPIEYYWCSNIPLIGIDDHANQTIRSVSGSSLCDIPAFFCSINRICDNFKSDILKIEPGFEDLFSLPIPKPKDFPDAKSIVDVKQRRFFNKTNNYLPYLTALRTKPFMLLAGISGTGKSRIVRKLAQATTMQYYADENDRWSDNRPENFELIQVKPNWHNSMDVVGFYSNISKRYEFTPFIDFIVKAWQHTDTPYFLCLDEMNLAPVEEYFAEFLSAIESRSTDADGKYITDPIIKPFKDFSENVGKEMLKQLFGEADPIDKNPLAVQFYEKGLTLPPNLMVMGTVNMDETTFTFSRKVLDRAMSIEMNEVDYDKFLSGETDSMPLLTDMNPLLVNRPQQASEVKDNINGAAIVTYLKDVNSLLDGTPFKLGYRAANEAMLYVSACQDFLGKDFDEKKALDDFTLMKILSRIEGDDNRLGLDENDSRVAAIGTDAVIDGNEQHINLLNCLRAIVRKHIGQDSQTEKKINAMYRTLEREHFVSFWA